MFADRVTVTKLYISRDHHRTLKRDSIGRNYNTRTEREKQARTTDSQQHKTLYYTHTVTAI